MDVITVILGPLYVIGVIAMVIEFIAQMLGHTVVAKGWRFVEASVLVTLAVGMFQNIGAVNDCCEETAFFSPSHRLSILVLIVLSLAAYFFSAHRKRLAPPGLEVLVNC